MADNTNHQEGRRIVLASMTADSDIADEIKRILRARYGLDDGKIEKKELATPTDDLNDLEKSIQMEGTAYFIFVTSHPDSGLVNKLFSHLHTLYAPSKHTEILKVKARAFAIRSLRGLEKGVKKALVSLFKALAWILTPITWLYTRLHRCFRNILFEKIFGIPIVENTAKKTIDENYERSGYIIVAPVPNNAAFPLANGIEYNPNHQYSLTLMVESLRGISSSANGDDALATLSRHFAAKEQKPAA